MGSTETARRASRALSPRMSLQYRRLASMAAPWRRPSWRRDNPHDMNDVNALRHESLERIWSGDNNGVLKQWDTSGHSSDSVACIQGGLGAMTDVAVWEAAGAMAASHAGGIAFVDTKAGKVIHSQYTKKI